MVFYTPPPLSSVNFGQIFVKNLLTGNIFSPKLPSELLYYKIVKVYLVLLLFTFNTQAIASLIVSAAYGYSGLTTKALNEQKGNAAGSTLMLKFGMMDKEFELGCYTTKGNFIADVKHDGVENEIAYEKQSLGLYATYYRKKVYFEFGYGKTTIDEKFTSTLSTIQQNIVKDIYNVQDDKIDSFEARMLGGIKLFSFWDFITTMYIEKTIELDVDHQTMTVGLEIKAQI
jgi:hypothetical protein